MNEAMGTFLEFEYLPISNDLMNTSDDFRNLFPSSRPNYVSYPTARAVSPGTNHTRLWIAAYLPDSSPHDQAYLLN
jgi:hypothetical protein